MGLAWRVSEPHAGAAEGGAPPDAPVRLASFRKKGAGSQLLSGPSFDLGKLAAHRRNSQIQALAPAHPPAPQFSPHIPSSPFLPPPPSSLRGGVPLLQPQPSFRPISCPGAGSVPSLHPQPPQTYFRYLALAVSLEDIGAKTHNAKATMLGETLNEAIGKLLDEDKSPSRKVGGWVGGGGGGGGRGERGH